MKQFSLTQSCAFLLIGMGWVLALAPFVGSIGGAQAASRSPTIERIIERGSLRCIVDANALGFSYRDAQGMHQGFNVAWCRAIAAAILGPQYRLETIPTTPVNRFVMLSSREGELLSRSSSWTLSRDADLGLDFAITTYYSGQGFLVRQSDNITQLTELDGGSVCIPAGTTLEANLGDFAKLNNITIEQIPMEQIDDALQAFSVGRCDAFTADTSYLASSVAVLQNADNLKKEATPSHANDHYVILPDVISKEPLSLAVREGDPMFKKLVAWVVYGLITAEEAGVTQANIDDMLAAPAAAQNPTLLRLLGKGDNFGQLLGVDANFIVNAIRETGNYGEIFQRYLAPLGLKRGLNALYRDGGILYAPPFR